MASHWWDPYLEPAARLGIRPETVRYMANRAESVEQRLPGMGRHFVLTVLIGVHVEQHHDPIRCIEEFSKPPLAMFDPSNEDDDGE